MALNEIDNIFATDRRLILIFVRLRALCLHTENDMDHLGLYNVAVIHEKRKAAFLPDCAFANVAILSSVFFSSSVVNSF